MKNIKNLKLGLLAILTCMSTSAFAADDSLQIHGYVMNGSDFSNESGRSTVALHRDPNGDPRGKLGDFGNVYWHDYFTSLNVNKKWTAKDGSWADYTYELITYGNKTVEAGQSYARFGGLSFLPKDANVWAGRRNLSIRDGVFAYNLKDVGLDAAIGYDGKNLDVTLGYVQADWGHAVKSRDVVDASYTIGKAEVGVTYVQELEEEATPVFPGDTKSSMSAYGAYNMDKFLGVMPGNTRIMAQVGKGVIAQYLNTSRLDNSADEDTSMRVTLNGRYDGIKDVSIKPSVILESTNRDAAGTEVETSLFAGANISQKINDKIVMHYEANLNNTTNKNGGTDDGTAYKIAVGPSLQIESLEWVRPMITVNVALVGGDKAITGLSKDSEVRFGYQMEAWF